MMLSFVFFFLLPSSDRLWVTNHWHISLAHTHRIRKSGIICLCTKQFPGKNKTMSSDLDIMKQDILLFRSFCEHFSHPYSMCLCLNPFEVCLVVFFFSL